MTHTRRIGAAALAAVIVLVAVWYLAAWHPGAKKLDAVHKARAAAEQQVGQLASEVSRLQSLVWLVPADRKKLAVLEAAMPDQPSLAQALSQLNQAATLSGVNLTSVGPSAPAGATTSGAAGRSSSAAAGVQVVPITLSASGSYAGLMAFLTRLAQMPRVVVVDNLSISGAATQLTASISAKIFFAGPVAP